MGATPATARDVTVVTCGAVRRNGLKLQ